MCAEYLPHLGHCSVEDAWILFVLWLKNEDGTAALLRRATRKWFLRMVLCRRALSYVAWAMHTSGGRISGVLFWRAFVLFPTDLLLP